MKQNSTQPIIYFFKMNDTLKKYIPAILFTFSTLLYFNTINHGYVLDDFSVIKENFVVKDGINGISTIFSTPYRYGYGFQSGSLYRPIPLTIFALEWQLLPDQPWFAHLINVLIYALSSVLLFNLLSKWINSTVAIISSLLFISHPLHTEVVANIKSLDELLSFMLLIGMLNYYQKYYESKSNKHLLISLVLFFIAMLTKESAITFIAIVPLVMYFFKDLPLKNALQCALPFLIPLVPYFGLRYKALGSLTSNAPVAVIDNLLVGIKSASELFASKIYLVGLYLYKLLVPLNLSSDYSIQHLSSININNPLFLASLIVLILLIIITVNQLIKKSLIGFGLLFFAITFSISSNLVFTIGTHFGERLLFIPLFGFCVITGYYINRLILVPRLKNIGVFLSLALLLAYSIKTISRNSAWESDLTLYSTDIITVPNSARLNYSLGLEIMKEKAVKATNQIDREKYFADAETYLERATELYPAYSDAFGNLGLLKYRTKDYAKAEQYYLKAIELNPNNAIVLSNLGAIYFEMKQYEAAKNTYSRALRANPNMADANANMGATLATLGQLQASIPYFSKAIELNPTNAQNYYFLGITYQNLGNQKKAKEYMDLYNRMK